MTCQELGHGIIDLANILKQVLLMGMIGKYTLEQIKRNAKKDENVNRQLLTKLSKRNSRNLDRTIHTLHDEVFSETNCLACANCCKTLGPGITDTDIRRMARALRIKPSQLTADYLNIDEDGDYVFKSMPCPFLDNDNYCIIYNDRPVACREYPHTDRPRMYQVLNITLKNIAVCPAVYEIVEKLRQQFG